MHVCVYLIYFFLIQVEVLYSCTEKALENNAMMVE